MIYGCCGFWMLRTFDALIVTPMRGMRGSFLPRSYRSIHQPRGVFSTVLLKSVAVFFYAHGAARRHFHYALGHLWGGALISVPDENTRATLQHFLGSGLSQASLILAKNVSTGIHNTMVTSNTGSSRRCAVTHSSLPNESLSG